MPDEPTTIGVPITVSPTNAVKTTHSSSSKDTPVSVCQDCIRGKDLIIIIERAA